MSVVEKVAHRLRDPVGVAYNNYEKLQNGYLLKSNSILNLEYEHSPKTLVNVANFNTYNGGDALLSVVLRDLIDHCGEASVWKKIHAHAKVNGKTIAKINNSDGLVIGGGGLFLVDNNSNQKSGWQWAISQSLLNEIEVPIAIFAVGYNRFRGQSEFPSLFVDNINTLVDRSTFFGLRNHGSIRAIRNYLSPELREKVVYQPCMTTVIKDLYSGLTFPSPRDNVIALNMAFDRPELRFGEDYEQKFKAFCYALKELSLNYKIEYVSHAIPDERFMGWLDKYKVPYEPIKLYRCSGIRVVDYYKTVGLTIGMRGHAQMIPFGVGNAILSVITHDKMRWFLEDNEIEQYGVEFSDSEFSDKILDQVSSMMQALPSIRLELQDKRRALMKICFDNASRLYGSFS